MSGKFKFKVVLAESEEMWGFRGEIEVQSSFCGKESWDFGGKFSFKVILAGKEKKKWYFGGKFKFKGGGTLKVTVRVVGKDEKKGTRKEKKKKKQFRYAKSSHWNFAILTSRKTIAFDKPISDNTPFGSMRRLPHPLHIASTANPHHSLPIRTR